MGANHRPVTTVTRSISFDQDTFGLMEARRIQLRMTRSEFLRALLEDRLGVMSHPELNVKGATLIREKAKAR